MSRIVRKKTVILFFLLVPLILGLIFPQITFAKDPEKRIQELEKKLESLEKQVIEYKNLLKEVLEEKEAAKPEKVVVKEAPAPAKEKHPVWSKFDVQLGGRIKIDTHYDTVAFDAYNDFLGVVSSRPNYKGDSINFNP
ncbi:hypothetical protein DMNBHIDG_00788 [Candidatus Methanoperedenaceae archaeon GB37]|nr:hypothetical protein DMNBHIDG_00788 [Candidatus Methanoperedenaceae archaeon GB37]